jgi:transcription-repair coupling factor (superfamily II helicase)
MPFSPLPSIASPAKQTQLFQPFINYLEQSGRSILIAAESQGRRQLLMEQMRSLGLEADMIDNWRQFLPTSHQLALTVLPLQAGFEVNDQQYSLVAEADLFEEHELVPRRKRQRGPDPDKLIKSLGELQLGEAVVHIDHGIGRYRGLQVIETDGSACEYLTIEYANNDKVYVPVSQLNLVTRFSSTDADNAPLHQLGSKQWEKAKRRAAQKVRDAAAELLDIYAKRQARSGIQCQKPDADYHAFANDFPFTETPDQKQTIEQVIDDMTRAAPMDRLVCGDVGFGKTEVAMRAAFIAIQSGWQVAVLVPTTLLAEQHYQTFIDRFSNWPVKIEQLSRFKSTTEQRRIHQQLQSGDLDIVIGTHILLQQQTRINQLGLLIVDEEHRFGVRQKERIKSWRSSVDMLAMTATPIPRTLNLSFSQIRDLSIIATPPEKRLAVKTFVKPFNQDVIREATLREIMRGGQLYFLHNEVATIDKITQQLAELLPQARISMAHGQMHERQLERVMSDFYHRRTNVLVCTAIIESGIDVPTANTIIINRAERFGLAQLHQLRGRVGRSHHQAYAYLLTSGDQPPTRDAEKRLQAIEQLEELGSGFSLATQDLEIRGAGELLGEEQSGQMEAVGFELYQEMLDKAVNEIKEGKDPQLTKPIEPGTEINASVSALIPQDFIPDIHTRLSLYKRLANVANDQELDHFYQEMIDRFGPLPQATLNLITQNRLRLKAKALGINKIDIGNESGTCDFTNNPNIEPKRLIELIQQYPKWYQLKNQHRLKFAAAEDDPYESITKLLEALT